MCLASFNLFIAFAHFWSLDKQSFLSTVTIFYECLSVCFCEYGLCVKRSMSPSVSASETTCGSWTRKMVMEAHRLQCTSAIMYCLGLCRLPRQIVNRTRERRVLDKQEDDICNFEFNVKYVLQVHLCRHTHTRTRTRTHRREFRKNSERAYDTRDGHMAHQNECHAGRAVSWSNRVAFN